MGSKVVKCSKDEMKWFKKKKAMGQIDCLKPQSIFEDCELALKDFYITGCLSYW